MKSGSILACAAVVLLLPAWASATPVAHVDKVSSYEGTNSCTVCHEKSAKEVAVSLHYQQQAAPRFLEGGKAGEPAGMMRSF